MKNEKLALLRSANLFCFLIGGAITLIGNSISSKIEEEKQKEFIEKTINEKINTIKK